MNINECKQFLKGSVKIVGFSGAGISTDSGISDFRSPNGLWAKNRMVTFQEFVSSEQDRIEYWRLKAAIWPEIRDAKPNTGHLSFVNLYQQKKLLGMITQNIDGLHQKAGLPNEKVIELHGTTTEVICLKCQDKISMDEACARIQNGENAPKCQKCSGILKPATISFGQMMPIEEMEQAAKLCKECDLFISIGSSLVVYPAASFPALAKENGAKLIILNREETPLDPLADAVFHAEINDVLPQLIS